MGKYAIASRSQPLFIFLFAVKLKCRLYDVGNKLVCYIAAIFLRISPMSIAYQGDVIKVARNKKALWEKM